MAEKRRLFIDPNRLADEIDFNGQLILNSSESHYLSRVMRMRTEDKLDIVDGEGHLWDAKILGKNIIKLKTSYENPSRTESRERPLIYVAIVMPKKGFDNFLQMSSEIGIDIIQPLISKRSVVKENNNEKSLRWKKIILEAVEQSERLWCPQLRTVLKFEKWVNDLPSDSPISFATTRMQGLQDCVKWLYEIPLTVNQAWMVIGPEGGWDTDEESLAFDSGLVGVSMGKTILRTSTAAVYACQLMSSWRRGLSSFEE